MSRPPRSPVPSGFRFRSSGRIAGGGAPEAEKMIDVLNLNHPGLVTERRTLIESLDKDLNGGEGPRRPSPGLPGHGRLRRPPELRQRRDRIPLPRGSGSPPRVSRRTARPEPGGRGVAEPRGYGPVDVPPRVEAYPGPRTLGRQGIGMDRGSYLGAPSLGTPSLGTPASRRPRKGRSARETEHAGGTPAYPPKGVRHRRKSPPPTRLDSGACLP